ncbi:hypothetical protein TWF694_009698 [Orbilia ellipsospora]|uniref:Uncharacterized protein n=1 Tax=Orbilia ellipsospora TaxID=2528407 RepID=A0AAV9XCK5_9PEZI
MGGSDGSSNSHGSASRENSRTRSKPRINYFEIFDFGEEYQHQRPDGDRLLAIYGQKRSFLESLIHSSGGNIGDEISVEDMRRRRVLLDEAFDFLSNSTNEDYYACYDAWYPGRVTEKSSKGKIGSLSPPSSKKVNFASSVDSSSDSFDEDDEDLPSKMLGANSAKSNAKNGIDPKNKGKSKRDDESDDEVKYTDINDWLNDRLDRVTKRRADAMVKAIRAGKKIAEADLSNVEDDPKSLLRDMPNIPWYFESRTAPDERARMFEQMYQRRPEESDEDYLSRIKQPLNPRLLLRSQKNKEDEQNDDEMGFDHEGLPPPPPRQYPTHRPSLENEMSIEEQFGHTAGDNTIPSAQENDGVWMRPMMRSWLWRLFFWRDERTFYPSRENMTVPKRYRFVKEVFRIDNNFERVHVCSPGESYFEHLYYSDKFFVWPDSLPVKPPGRSARDRWIRKLGVQQPKPKPTSERESNQTANKETGGSGTGSANTGPTSVIGKDYGSSKGNGDVGEQKNSGGNDTVVPEPGKSPELNDPETKPRDTTESTETTETTEATKTTEKSGLWSQVSGALSGLLPEISFRKDTPKIIGEKELQSSQEEAEKQSVLGPVMASGSQLGVTETESTESLNTEEPVV